MSATQELTWPLGLAIRAIKIPKLTLADVEARIVDVSFGVSRDNIITCDILLDNTFSVRGESGVFDMSDFRLELGQKLAKDKAMSKVWDYLTFLQYEERKRAYVATESPERMPNTLAEVLDIHANEHVDKPLNWRESVVDLLKTTGNSSTIRARVFLMRKFNLQIIGTNGQEDCPIGAPDNERLHNYLIGRLCLGRPFNLGIPRGL